MLERRPELVFALVNVAGIHVGTRAGVGEGSIVGLGAGVGASIDVGVGDGVDA
jgi:hypothetical protein